MVDEPARSPYAVGWQFFEAPPFDLEVGDARRHQPSPLTEPVARAAPGVELRAPLRCGFTGDWTVDDEEVDGWVRANAPPLATAVVPTCTAASFALGNTLTAGSEWLRGAFDWAHVHAVHGAQRLEPEDLRPQAAAFRDDWCGAVYGTSIFLVDHQTQMHQLHLVDDEHVVALTIENVFASRLDTVVTVRAFGAHDAKRTRLVRSWQRYVERRYVEDHQIWSHKATGRPPRYGPYDDEVIRFDRYWRSFSRAA